MRYIEIARIMGVHGLKGDLRIMPYNAESPLFVPGSTLYLKDGGSYRFCRIVRCHSGGRGLRIHLEGVESREEARALYGGKLFVPREAFEEPGEDETYVIDLIGMAVVDADSKRCYGTIREVMETGANDCYVVRGEGPEIMVPATREVVLRVDLDARVVTVRLPEGLLDIYEG